MVPIEDSELLMALDAFVECGKVGGRIDIKVLAVVRGVEYDVFEGEIILKLQVLCLILCHNRLLARFRLELDHRVARVVVVLCCHSRRNIHGYLEFRVQVRVWHTNLKFMNMTSSKEGNILLEFIHQLKKHILVLRLHFVTHLRAPILISWSNMH